MEHHDWEWSDNDGAHGDAETADLSGDDLGQSGGFGDFGDHDLGGQDLGGHDFGAGPDDVGGAHLPHDNLDEPLGTENAVGAYDADIADHGDHGDHGTAFAHDDPGHTDEAGHTDDAHT